VIASDICGIPYQVVDAKTGFLVPPGDIPALTDRLSKIFSDTALAQKLGLAARKKANSEYRADLVAKETVNVYKDMLEDSGTHPIVSPSTL
jgi:glycosyltransferase involved in cell wall biosynthesis